MKPLSLYLETSVWNFLDAPDALDKQQSTIDFFSAAQRDHATLYTSNVAMAEISRAETSRKKWLEGVVNKFNPVLLELDEDCIIIANEYIKVGIIPERYRDDAFHLAIATCYALDVLVSWNMKHLVKLSTRRGASAINKLYGYREIEICTPEEVF